MKRTLAILVAALIMVTTIACSVSLNTPLAPSPSPAQVQATNAPIPTLAPPDPNLSQNEEHLVLLYQRVSPGVVSIGVLTAQGGGLGSGFVFDKQGHIVTNYHVVEQATDLEVDFPSGLKVRGKVIGTDIDSDLAVIKVEAPADALFPLPLGDDEKVKVGQTVVAIGNPFGLSGTMTIGIVSAKSRTLESFRQSSSGGTFTAGAIIQTDASINPGNSGGPLLNLQGEVIGINRAIRTTSSTADGEPVNSGIGFAISSGIVKRVVPVLISKGKYDYPYLGVSSREEISLMVQEALGLPSSIGAYITDVVPGGPADKAGLRGGSKPTSIPNLKAGGDLITAIDGHPVRVFGDLLSYLMVYKSPGDTVVLKILRDNTEKEVSVVLGKRP
ncbi:MAG TPA: trypsin-like peptidase domain-containing protein [Anaerolineaceae bacterium]